MVQLSSQSTRRVSSILRGMTVGVLAAMLGLVMNDQMKQAFSASPISRGSVSCSSRFQLRAAQRLESKMRRQAQGDMFDPFGWKANLKDGVLNMAGIKDDPPTEVEEKMILEIFDKFDVDKDQVLSLDEFNSLQQATEGPEALYNLDQLKQLLVAVNPDIEAPEKGMPFTDYRRLYVERRLRELYETDVARDHIKVFGVGNQPEASDVDDPLAEGRSVVIEGLKGAAELNGREGKIGPHSETEQGMKAEGRVIVLLDDGERLALKRGNVKPKPSISIE